jgi:U3 small nucleolar RNA-associated protein 18
VLLSSGLDADVYVWDVRNTSRCVKRFHNEDGTVVSALASVMKGGASVAGGEAGAGMMSSEEYYMAAGSESGVVSLYNMNLSLPGDSSNILDSTSVGAKRKSALIGVTGLRSPVVSADAHKDVMNLTTKVTSIAMHPAGQLMAIASDQKRDQLKLVHLPSGSVFENWPTTQTPVRRVQCMEFSPSMDVLALGNNRGRVVMYKIGHYASPRGRREDENRDGTE